MHIPDNSNVLSQNLWEQHHYPDIFNMFLSELSGTLNWRTISYIYILILSWRRKGANLKQSNSGHYSGPRKFQRGWLNKKHIQILEFLFSVTHFFVNIYRYLHFDKIKVYTVFFLKMSWHQNENILASVVSQLELPTLVQKNTIQAIVCRNVATYGQ